MFERFLLIVRLYLSCDLILFSNSYISVYHTENSLVIQSYDCVYETYPYGERMKFCRQLN